MNEASAAATAIQAQHVCRAIHTPGGMGGAIGRGCGGAKTWVLFLRSGLGARRVLPSETSREGTATAPKWLAPASELFRVGVTRSRRYGQAAGAPRHARSRTPVKRRHSTSSFFSSPHNGV